MKEGGEGAKEGREGGGGGKGGGGGREGKGEPATMEGRRGEKGAGKGGRKGGRRTRQQQQAGGTQMAEEEEEEEEDEDEDDGGFSEGKDKRAMPGWLQEAAAARGMLDIVTPFWTTNYVISRSVLPKQPPFFNSGAGGGGFEKCLSQFVRFLLERAVGPFADVLYVVRGLVRLNHALPLFLLPYLVAETWCYGGEEERELLLKEVVGVLSQHEGGREGGREGRRGRGESDDHVATQAILSLLDTLTEWCNQPIPTPPPSPPPPTPGTSTATEAIEAAAAAAKTVGVWDAQLQKKLKDLLNRIPETLLVEASMRIGAHSRALKHLEIYVRRKAGRREGGREGGSGGGGGGSEGMMFSVDSSFGGEGWREEGGEGCCVAVQQLRMGRIIRCRYWRVRKSICSSASWRVWTSRTV